MARSPLAALRARRDDLTAAHVVDLKVPLWTDPEMRLRIALVDDDLVGKQQKRVEQAKPGLARAIAHHANAVVIAAATRQVVIGDAGTEQATVTLDDPEFRESLGVSAEAPGADVILAIAIRDGDVATMAAAVLKHSGYAEEQIDQLLAGE